MHPVTRPALVLATAGLWALCAAASAGAVSFPDNTFGAAPTARFLNGRPPSALGPLLVGNTTRDPFRVRVSPVVLDQRLDGVFQPRLTAAGRRTARRLIALSASRFTLAPGGQQDFTARWIARPRGARSAALGILVEGVRGTGARSRSGVGARADILSLAFVQLPGSLAVRGGLFRLRAEQTGRRRIALLSRVRNVGRELGRARHGSVVVRNAARHVVFRRRWGGGQLDFVLPRSTVDFPVKIARLLPAGRYTATTTVRFGARRTSRTTAFTLLGPNELPTVRLAIGSLQATGKAGGPAHVRLAVNNVGTAPARVDAAVTVVRVGAGGARRTVARTRLRRPALKPGASTGIHAEVGKLAAGRYRVDVALAAGDDTQTRSTGVLAGNGFSTVDSLRRFFTGHPTRTVGLLALLLIALLLAALLRAHRAMRRHAAATTIR